MHIAFAVSFFILIGLCETLRHGIFGLSPFETSGIIYGALAFCALIILRGDILFALRMPRDDLYGVQRLNWTWRRSLLGMVLGPLLWIIPLAYGMTLIQINIIPVAGGALVQALIVQVFLVALALELFFREAVIKSFRNDTSAIYLISGLAFFIFYVPQGVPAAMIATGAGLFYLTLRLIGTNILVVVLLHGATTVMFTQVLSLGLTSGDEWAYAGYFLAASAALSAAVYQLFAPKQSEYIYA